MVWWFLFSRPGIQVVYYIIDELKKKDTDIWKQLEGRVELKIGEKLASYHVSRMYNEVFKVFERRFKDPKTFDADDLDMILDKSFLVFPQGWPTLGWSYELPLPILLWMPFMIAGYQHMINKDEQPMYVALVFTLILLQYMQGNQGQPWDIFLCGPFCMAYENDLPTQLLWQIKAYLLKKICFEEVHFVILG